jgi:hypothetical protein
MLRVRQISKIAAERPLLDRNETSWTTARETTGLLYHNSEHTNLNGVVALGVVGAYVYIVAASYWMVLLAPFALLARLLSLSLQLVSDSALTSFEFLKCRGTSAVATVRRILARLRKAMPSFFRPVSARSTVPMDPVRLSMESRFAADNEGLDLPPGMVNESV